VNRGDRNARAFLIFAVVLAVLVTCWVAVSMYGPTKS